MDYNGIKEKIKEEIIMTASDHRLAARNALKGNWLWAALTTLVASLLGGIATAGGSSSVKTEYTETLLLNSSFICNSSLSHRIASDVRLETDRIVAILSVNDFALCATCYEGAYSEN